MEIGSRIVYLRKQAGLTQAELAEKLYVSPKTVSKWENGYGLPDIKILPQLAAALEVDSDYLLTGRGVPPKSAATPATVPTCTAEEQETPSGENIYTLRLWQTTHSNLTGWLLWLNIIMLLLAVIGSPFSEINTEGLWRPYSVLSFLYPSLTGGTSLYEQSGVIEGFLIAISVLWIVFFLAFAAICIRGIVASLDGRNDYFVKFAWVQFGGVAVFFCFSFALCIAVNRFTGEICFRPNGVFAVLFMCTLLHLILTLFFDRHRRPIGHLKGNSVISVFVALAASVALCVLPNTVVPMVLAAESVSLSEWNVQLQLEDPDLEEMGWQRAYSTLAVRANVRLTELVNKTVSFTVKKQDGSTHPETHFADAENIRTFYKTGYYYNIFSVNFDFIAEGGDSFSDFVFTFSIFRNSSEMTFTAECAEPEILPPQSEISAFWDRGDLVYKGGGSVQKEQEFEIFYDLYICEQTTLLGYETNLPDLGINYTLGEYVRIGGKDINFFGFEGFGSESVTLSEEANNEIAVYVVKDGDGGYKRERAISLRLCIRATSLLSPYMYVRILTDRGTIPIVQAWENDFIADRYRQSIEQQG